MKTNPQRKHALQLIAVLFLFPLAGNSQNLHYELGITSPDFHSFGLVFQKPLRENKMLRINVDQFRLQAIDDGSSGYDDGFVYSADFDFGIGFEYRKQIANGLSLIHGPELSSSFEVTTFKDVILSGTINPNETIITTGIGYLLGLHADLGKRLYFSLEGIPRVSMRVYTVYYYPDWEGSFRFNTMVRFTAGIKFPQNQQ